MGRRCFFSDYILKMEEKQFFERTLKDRLSSGLIIICLLVPLLLFVLTDIDWVIWVIVLLSYVPGLILIAVLLMGIPRYTIVSKESIVVVKKVGVLTFNRHECTIEPIDSSMLKRSVSLVGNGGLLGYSGRFYNKKIGNYTMCALNTRELALITTPKDEKYVINLRL